MKKASGIIMTILGVIGTIGSIITIRYDMTPKRTSSFFSYLSPMEAYSYTPPFTAHEIFVLAILIVSILLLIFGIVTMVKTNKGDEA